MENRQTHPSRRTSNTAASLKNLQPVQISMIEEALSAVGDFGEVHLVVEKGRMRYIVLQKSMDALHWQPLQNNLE